MRTETKTILIYDYKELNEYEKKRASKTMTDWIIDDNFNFLEENFIDILHEEYGIKNARLGYSIATRQGDGVHFDCDDFLTPKIKALAYQKLSDDDRKIIDGMNISVQTIHSVSHYEYASINDVTMYAYDCTDDEEKSFERLESILQDIYLTICGRLEKIGYQCYDVTDDDIQDCIDANGYEFLENGDLYHE